MKKILLLVLFAVPFLLPTPAQAAEELPPPCTSDTVNAWSDEQGVFMVKTDGVDECLAFVSTYTMPDDWNGEGWNETASPQFLFASNASVITAEVQRFPAELPKCGGVQVDLTGVRPPEKITYPEGIDVEVIRSHSFMLDVKCDTTPPTSPTPTSPTPTTTSPTPTKETSTPPPPTHETPSPCQDRNDCLPATGGSGPLWITLGLIAALAVSAGAWMVWRPKPRH